MKPRLRTIFLVLLLAVYGVALKQLDSVFAAVAPAVLAQPYPGVSPTPTDSAYPGPSATGTATAAAIATATATGAATATAIATATATGAATATASATATATASASATATPTPTASNTAAVPLSPSARRQTATQTPTVSQRQAAQLNRETRVPARDARPAIATPGAEAVVAPTESVALESRLASNAERPVLPSLAPPAADLLPPVANQPTGPGAPLTLIVGAVVAGVAYWAWRRWEPTDAEE